MVNLFEYGDYRIVLQYNNIIEYRIVLCFMEIIILFIILHEGIFTIIDVKCELRVSRTIYFIEIVIF